MQVLTNLGRQLLLVWVCAVADCAEEYGDPSPWGSRALGPREPYVICITVGFGGLSNWDCVALASKAQWAVSADGVCVCVWRGTRGRWLQSLWLESILGNPSPRRFCTLLPQGTFGSVGRQFWLSHLGAWYWPVVVWSQGCHWTFYSTWDNELSVANVIGT